MISLAAADTDSDSLLSEEELLALTIAQIKDLASQLGYEITATRKSAIIAQFLAQQAAAQENQQPGTTPGDDPADPADPDAPADPNE